MAQISFDGQVVVVTGGGRGIGRAHCHELARLGAAVVVNDIAPEHADAVVAEIAAEGGAATPSYHSVTTPEGAQAIVDTAVERFGRLDGVVNNAGFMRNGYFENQTAEMLDAMLDVHIRGAFFVTQAAWPVMRSQSYGRVVMTSSGGGLFAMQGEANYAAAKAGLYGLCKALAFEGGALGILVNAVLPGGVTTITANDPVPDTEKYTKPGVRDTVRPRRRPEAVAPFVAYLTSRECPVNGEAFVAVAGVYARVFVGVAPGWTAPDVTAVTVDDIAAHFDEIRDQRAYCVPTDNHHHAELLAMRLGWTP